MLCIRIAHLILLFFDGVITILPLIIFTLSVILKYDDEDKGTMLSIIIMSIVIFAFNCIYFTWEVYRMIHPKEKDLKIPVGGPYAVFGVFCYKAIFLTIGGIMTSKIDDIKRKYFDIKYMYLFWLSVALISSIFFSIGYGTAYTLIRYGNCSKRNHNYQHKIKNNPNLLSNS